MKKFLFIFFFFCPMLVFAQSKDSSLISISVNNVDFSQFIELLEKESQIKIIYKPTWFQNLKVTITSNQEEIINVIKQIVPSDEFNVYKWNAMLVILNLSWTPARFTCTASIAGSSTCDVAILLELQDVIDQSDQLPNDSGELLLLERAELRVCDPPRSIDDHRERQGHQRVPERLRELHCPISADQGWVVESDLAGELPDFVSLIHGDADELQAVRPTFALQADEHRHLLPARRAPGRPEVDDQNLARPLGEGLVLAVRVGQRDPDEGRGALTGSRWCEQHRPGDPRAGGQRDHRGPHHEPARLVDRHETRVLARVSTRLTGVS